MTSFQRSALTALPLLLALTGCSNLHDVKHRWCDPEPVLLEAVTPVAPPPLPAAAQTAKIQLQADALFAFDGSSLGQMKPAGRKTLDELAAELRTGYIRIDQILLVGHTDRLGDASYNQRLSERRAQTVKQYLQDQGVTQPIEARGVGEADPVTSDCQGGKATPALVACLQPDRRVDVDVSGVRKVSQP